MSVLLGTRNTATVRAEKASAVRVVKDAIAFLERQPLVAIRVATLLSERLDATSALLSELSRDKGATGGDKSIFARLANALLSPPAAGKHGSHE
jgi:hypothetical protein